METNATLPADWKHQEPPKEQGMSAYYVIYCAVHFDFQTHVEAWANSSHDETVTFS